MTVKRLMYAVFAKLPIILLATIIFGAVGGYVNYVVIHEKYTATSTFYVLSKTSEDGSQSQGTGADYTDVRLSDLLVADYNELVKSRRVKEQVAANVGIENLKGYTIKVETGEETRVIKLSVTCEKPEMAARVADEMVSVFSETVEEILNVENVNVVDKAQIPTSPSSPAKFRNTLFSAVAGAAVAAGLIVVVELLDNTIRTADEIEETFGIPVLAQIGRMRGTSDYEKKSTDSYETAEPEDEKLKDKGKPSKDDKKNKNKKKSK